MSDINNNLRNEESAFVNDEKLLNKKIKAIPVPEQRKDIDVEGKFLDSVASAAINSSLDLSSLNSFNTAAQTRDQVYDLIDQMCEDPIVAAVLETYSEDATEYNDNGDIIWAESDNSDIQKFVTYLLTTMQVNKHAYEWVYSLCKYGDLYLRLYRESEFDDEKFFGKKTKNKLNEDLKIQAFKDNDKYAHYVEAVANPAEMFDLTRLGKTIGFIKAKTNFSNIKQDNLINFNYRYKFKKSDIFIYSAADFVHASLTDGVSRYTEEVKLFLDDEDPNQVEGTSYQVKKGQSLLYNTFKIWRELSLLENSMLLNRITKSSIVRLINVEIGDMPKEQVGPHLQGIKALMEQKSAINTGNSISEYTNPGPVENNIYVPTNNGKGAITTSQVGGDVNVSQIPDIEYFQNKYFGASRIPKQYFGLTDDGAGFSGGESLAIISSRYAKMVKRIQNALIQAITSVVNLMLLDKGLDTYVNNFTIKMQPPTTKEEMDRRENMSSKIQIASDIMTLLSDIDNVPSKLRIAKALLSNIINDADVLKEIEDQITLLEDNGEGDTSNPEDKGSDDLSTGGGSDFDFDNDPLNLDAELGLEEPNTSNEESEEENTEETNLPTPEELGVDMTDSDTEEAE